MKGENSQARDEPSRKAVVLGRESTENIRSRGTGITESG